MKPIRTQCHCGSVSLELTRPVKQMTQCNCSICRRYGALWAYQQRKAVTVSDDERRLRSYVWGDGNLAFFHCSQCGCVTHWELTDHQEDGSDMVGTNMRNIVDRERVADLPIRVLDGDGSWKVLSRSVEPNWFKTPGAKAKD